MSYSVTSILQAALRGLNVRQTWVADNIANADTPGYKARRVRFEDQLRRAIREASDDTSLLSRARAVVETDSTRSGTMDGNSVDLDQELLAMTDTTMRYNAVAQALSERIALYRSVITDGRG